MMRELPASFVGEPQALKSWAESGPPFGPGLDAEEGRGRFSFEGHLLWIYKGAHLEVLSVEKGEASKSVGWLNFGHLLGDENLVVSQVSEFRDHLVSSESMKSSHWLLVVLSRTRSTSFPSIICLVDGRLSKILKAIECTFRITCLEPVSLSSSGRSNVWPLAPELELLRGVIVVGTEGGLVFFVDLCLDVETDFAEDSVPNKLTYSPIRNQDMELKRKSALINGQNVGLQLNSDALNKAKCFMYRANDGTVLQRYPYPEVVFVSCLKYVPQINTLCVGFSFGGFQFWDLKELTLECSCAIEPGLQPVIGFTFQEPENDPRNFCYLWLVRGFDAGLLNSSHPAPSTAYLYALSFENKEWIPEYGPLYSRFISCSCRFEYNLTTRPHLPELDDGSCSRLISCYTIAQGSRWAYKSTDEDVCLDLSLCLFAWEAYSEANESSSMFFAIFDLNQWYQAQMPTSFGSSEDSTAFSPFMAVFSLADVGSLVPSDAFLDLKLHAQSITKYRSNLGQNDLHYFPSSLSFDVTILSEHHVLETSYLGLQKRLLAQMVSSGPSILIDPKDMMNSCLFSGLLPTELSSSYPTISNKREALLTLLLENDELSFIIEAIYQWAVGDEDHVGCNCRLILDWIWKRVSAIKSSIDTISLPLFNFSAEPLDNSKLQVLNSYEVDLKSLSLLLKTLQTQGTPTTEQGLQELNLRCEVTNLIAMYLRVMLWLLDCGLLPEHEEGEQFGETEVAYPKTALIRTYKDRRQELQSINPSTVQGTDLLVIDGLVEELKDSVSSLWKRGGGSGLYPPPSIHALLGIYLLESVSLEQKHQIMLYFLLDMAAYLSDRQADIAEKIRLFPAAFSLKPCLTKLVQGVWALDHKAFDFALSTLLDPSVKGLVSAPAYEESGQPAMSEIQKRIITALLFQDQPFEAQQFMATCAMFSSGNLFEEKLHLSVLLSNHQIVEAFKYQRLCRNNENIEDLLMHFYMGCEQMVLMEKLFKLPLDSLEEEALIHYLLNVSSRANAKHLLALYFLINHKIIDAANFLHQNRSEFDTIADDELNEHTIHLMSLIDAHVAALPQSYTKLANEIHILEERKQTESRKRDLMPSKEPIKVTVPSSRVSIVARSDIIENVLEQIEDVWNMAKTRDPHSKSASPTTPFRKRINQKGLLLTKQSPFIRPPVADPRGLSKAATSSNRSPVSTPASLVSKKDTSSQFLSVGESSKVQPQSVRKSKFMACTPTSLKRTQSSGFGSDLLAVLSTPTINRVSGQSLQKKLGQSSLLSYITPTSILKVQSLMKGQSPVTGIPTPLSVKSRKGAESSQCKLRFSVPNSEESADNTMDNTMELMDVQMVSLHDNSFAPEPVSIPTSDSVSVPSKVNLEQREEPFDEKMESLFTFSPPASKSTEYRTQQKQEQELEAPSTPRHPASFVFSPPLTRSRSRKKTKPPPRGPISCLSGNPILEEIQDEAGSRDSSLSGRDDDSHKSETSDKSEESSQSKTRTPKRSSRKTETATPSHAMQLRPSSSKKKPLKRLDV